ncbi:MAG: hypothetical protein GQ570_14910 [Helicobacteraceae bacterium]|nr:hypothetical protein [Helicobacteraceae bacterium]
MVKVILLLLSVTILYADIYVKNCLPCHQKQPVSIENYFYKYLLHYSSEEDVKSAMVSFLKDPTKESSVMPSKFIDQFGIKSKTTLNEKELQQAVNIYWKKYTVFGKLK